VLCLDALEPEGFIPKEPSTGTITETGDLRFAGDNIDVVDKVERSNRT